MKKENFFLDTIKEMIIIAALLLLTKDNISILLIFISIGFYVVLLPIEERRKKKEVIAIIAITSISPILLMVLFFETHNVLSQIGLLIIITSIIVISVVLGIPWLIDNKERFIENNSDRINNLSVTISLFIFLIIYYF